MIVGVCRVCMVLWMGAGLLSCAQERPSGGAADGRPRGETALVEPGATDPKPSEFPGLHNVVAFAPGVYSGAVPEGAAGFSSLRDLGVRTIVSVDGATPDVEAARALGLRYVHLPIGYNGFTRERGLELARVVRDLPGPVYVHCHHGKHRSAAAAGSIVVGLGTLTPEQAVARMRVSGTSPAYTRLFGAVESSRVLTPAELASASAEFPTVCVPDDKVAAMIRVDDAFEHLKLIEKAGWTAPTDHPDLVPAAEAGQLVDLFRLIAEDPKTTSQSDDYRAMYAMVIAAAQELEDDLARGAGGDSAVRSKSFAAIAASCKDCHARFRDVVTPAAR